MNPTPFADDEYDEPWCAEFIEPVERFLRAGMAAVQIENGDEEGDEEGFDVDALLRHVGFLDDPLAEDDAGAEPGAGDRIDEELGERAELIPNEASVGDAPGIASFGDGPLVSLPAQALAARSTDSREFRAGTEIPDIEVNGGAARARVEGAIAVAARVGVVAAVATVAAGAVVTVAGVVLGTVAAACAAAAAIGAATGSLATLLMQRQHHANAASRGRSWSGPALSPARVDGTDRSDLDQSYADRSLADQLPAQTGIVASTTILVDQAGEGGADLFYEEMKRRLAFDPAEEERYDDVGSCTAPNAYFGSARLAWQCEVTRSPLFGLVPRVPDSVADEVEQFLSSPAADSLWLEQVVSESRQALQGRAWLTAAAQQPAGQLALQRSDSVQYLIMRRIKALLEEANGVPAGHSDQPLIFDLYQHRKVSPHKSVRLYNGRRPSAEYVILWATGPRWALTRRSLSGDTSTITDRSAAQQGNEVLEELLQTYSDVSRC